MKTQEKHPKLKWFLNRIFWPLIISIFISIIGMIWFDLKTECFVISKKIFLCSCFTFFFTGIIYRIFCYDSQEEEEDDNV